MRIHHIALAAALSLAPALAPANVLYKSVDERGVVTFSDQPPPTGTRVLEERTLGANGTSVSAPMAPGSNAIVPASPNESLLALDPMVAKANTALDEAERALALARRGTGSSLEVMKLRQTRLSPEDDRALEAQKRNVKLARQALFDLLKERRVAFVRAAAEDGAPRYGELRPLSSRPPQLASR